jgi:putative inorganic carbon (HCO3(-)) transporter
MSTQVAVAEPITTTPSSPLKRKTWEPKWTMAFVGVLAWCVVEYTRLPAMYPILIPLQLGKIAVAVAALGLITGTDLKVKPSREVRRVNVFLLWFLIATFISMLGAYFKDKAWGGFVLYLNWAVVFVLLSRVVTTPWRLRVFLFLYLLLMLKLSQHSVRYYVDALNAYDELTVETAGAGGGGSGFFANAADYGLGMCVIWPTAVCLLFSRPRFAFKMLLWACAIVILASIMICGSRGAVVGLVAIAVVFLIRNPSKLAVPLVLLLVLPAMFFVLPNAMRERFRSGFHWQQDKTASHRIVLWKAGIRIFEDHPIFGIGPDNYSMVHHLYYSQGEKQHSISVAHSTYVELLSEYGIFGALPMVALWLSVFLINSRTRKYLRAAHPNPQRTFEYCLTVGLDLGLVGYLASCAFISVMQYPHVWLLLGLACGLNTSVRNSPPVPEPPPAPKRLNRLAPREATC